MRTLKAHIVFLFVMMAHFAIAQTFVLPDNNLRDKLITDYPSVMQGNELLINEAGNLTGSLDLRNAGITNAEGIQYFTNIATLDLSGNQLSTIPDLSNTSTLKNFYASNNQLTVLPDFSNLTQLVDFQVMNNQLAALPDLTNASDLHSIYCSENNLTDFPDLSNFPNMRRLVIGENPYNEPIDFSTCVDLEELHIHRTGADTIIGLDKLTKLKILFAWENQIEDFSGLNANTTLTHCIIYKNPLSHLPELANKPNLNSINVNNCKLTFEEIKRILDLGSFPPSIYSGQNPFDFDDQVARESDHFEFTYPEENPLSTNIYVWKKGEAILDSSSSPVFSFSPLAYEDSGKYVLNVYNTEITSISLTSDTFVLQVKPCIEFSIPFLNIIEQECSKGHTIDLTNTQIAGGTTPFSYNVFTEDGDYDKTFNDNILENIPEGKYTITIIDANNCTASDNIILNKIDGCAPILTPDGDGVADTYFIENAGTAKIYDLKRHLLNTLQAPVAWDGTDQNGALLDAGYYILIQEGHPTVFITILR